MTDWTSYYYVRVTKPNCFVSWEWRRADGSLAQAFELYGQSSYVTAPELTVATTPQWMVDSSLTKALLKLREGSVNLGTALAESRACGDHLARTVNKIARAVNDFRRKNPKKVWDRIKRGGAHNASSSWLELQYGWTPLMNDIVGSAIAVDEAWSDPLADTSISVNGREYEERDIFIEPNPDNPRILGWRGTEKVCSQTILQYRLDNDFYVMFSSLGLVNPAEIAWELVPYSFVVDWFLPMGDWFSAMSADFGWRWQQGCSTQFTRMQARTLMSGKNTFLQGPRLWRVLPNGSPGYATGARMYRVRYVQSPIPRVVLKNPLAPLSLPRVASGLSLLAEAFR